RADEELPAGNLDFAHFKAVHGHLFQDVYDWAGKIRTVRMSKSGNPFAFPDNIENEANKLFIQLKNDKFLEGRSIRLLAEQSAHFLYELNAIHAFREGNGRTQLSFFLLLAEQAGHPVSLERFDPDAFLDAMITSFNGDEAPLAAIIEKLVEN